QRQPLATKERARVSVELRDLAGRLRPVGCERLEAEIRIELCEDRPRELESADHAALLEQDRRLRGGVLRHDGVARQVAGAEIFLEPGAHVDGRQLHASKTASRPGRWTGCKPFSFGSSCGKSARKWPPRLSLRASALRAMSRTTG